MYKMETFYRKKGRARELLTEEKQKIIFRPNHFLLEGEGNGKGFDMQIASSFCWGQGKDREDLNGRRPKNSRLID